MKKILYLLVILVLLISLTVSGIAAAKSSDTISTQEASENQTSEYINKYHPTITEKKLNPKYSLPLKYSDPVPNSDMTHIYFSTTWLDENDEDIDPYTVRITFPISWLNDSSRFKENETTIELSVPKKLLILDNESDNPNEITISFPSYYFKGLPIKPIPLKPTIEEKNGELNRDIEYHEALWFNHTAGDSITGARGRVIPYSYYNPQQDESFLAYHEIEFHGNTSGDFVEIISDIRSTPSVGVWFAVFRDDPDDYVIPASISASIGDTVNYEFLSNSTGYYVYCFLQNGDAWAEGYVIDITAPTDYEYFVGSSELDSIHGISNQFLVDTYPITIENLQSSGSTWHNSSYVDQRLDYMGSTLPANYVGLSYILGASGLFFDEWAAYIP